MHAVQFISSVSVDKVKSNPRSSPTHSKMPVLIHESGGRKLLPPMAITPSFLVRINPAHWLACWLGRAPLVP
jgi:hypothetical protein